MRPIPKFCLSFLFHVPLAANAQTFGGAYYCVQEFSGGLFYDVSRKAWEAARFGSDAKFVLRLKYEGTVKQEDSIGAILWGNYTITLTAEGEKYAALCTSDFEYPKKTVLVGGYGRVACEVVPVV